MSKEQKSFYAAVVLLAPFVVSLAFWITPWLGVPTLVVGLMFVFAAMLELGEQGIKERAAHQKGDHGQ